LREVRLALLEADVNFKVVKDFVERVKDRCLGQDVLKSLTPGQQVVKIVHEEMVELLGGANQGLDLRGRQPGVLMLVGLQGSGKTTTAAKLALHLRKQKMKPYLVPVDVYRPAAIEQLRTLAKQLDIPCFASTPDMNPVDIAAAAVEEAVKLSCTVVLLDTAGRLHIDEPLMQELQSIKSRVKPQEILFVADAMTGQDAVTVAARFNELLDLTGIVLTKMDGDARGGAALSVRAVTDKPIKYIGVGEKLSDLDVFHPDRIAGRAAICAFSIVSMTPIVRSSFFQQRAQHLALFAIQFSRFQQVRPLPHRPPQGFTRPPAPDVLVVAGQEHVRHPQPSILRRTGEVRKVPGEKAELLRIDAHKTPTWGVAFSPDGTKILTGAADNKAKLWNKDTGVLIRTFSGHTNSVWSVVVFGTYAFPVYFYPKTSSYAVWPVRGGQ
jgi:signal recognition particle GTPase